MPIQSYKLTDGTLTLGAGPLAVSCQLTKIQVTPTENVTTEDAVHVLCGDVLPASETADYAFKLEGTLLQDLAADGVVDYTWQNMGEEVPFSFIPNDALAREVSGTVRLVPLVIGGEVPKRPTSDFSWSIIGTPTFAAAA